ncbi:MAG: outer membrane protein transport protein [Nitrospira sp.]|nr:outer membrane protein transport protein [Nitrospira sp.]
MIQHDNHSRPSLFAPLLVTFLAIVATTSFSHQAFGEGFRILDQSASATAQGGAFAAQADDPSAVHYNPAAITNLPGLQMTVGTLLVNGDIEFRPLSGPAIEGDFGGTFANPPPSSFFVSAKLGDLGWPSFDSLTLGLGVYSPFGNITRYPRTSGLAPVLTRAASPILDVTPTVAFRANPMLALGAGLDIYTFSDAFGEGHVEIQQTAADLARAGFPFAPDDDIELNGRDTALGYHAGLLWTPLRNEQGQPLVNVALVYRSRATLNLTGQFLNRSREFALGAKADLNLPQVVTTGLAVWPIRDTRREWKLEVDVDYADWTSFDHLDVTLSNGAVLPNPRNWQSSYVVMAGTEYKFISPALLPSWDVSIRGGYVFADSPVPERTFKPDVPDSNSHSYSAGIGFLCQRGGTFLGAVPCGTGQEGFGVAAIGIDVAYQGIFYQSRGISNNQDPRVHGVWDTTIHVVSLNLRMNFDASRSF